MKNFQKKPLKTILLLFLLINTFDTYSKEIIAKSLKYKDVKKAVKLAVPGDVVKLPSGTENWYYGQGITVPGGISIKGSGKDQTLLKRAQASQVPFIIFDGSNNKASELSDITFIGGYFYKDKEYGRLSRGIDFVKGCTSFKVYNCRFENFANYAITVNDRIGEKSVQKGVIFNNEFIDNYHSNVQNYGYGIVVNGNGTWTNLELGTKNAVFIEDNYFSGNRHHVASNNGSKYVFRYNDVKHTNKVRNFSMADAHGKSSSPIGSRSYEIYNNKFYTESNMESKARTAIGIRGGDGVIFNNTSSTSIYRTIELWTEGFSCGTYPGINQIRSLYIWNNDKNDHLKFTNDGVANNCEASVKKGRDYFLFKKPEYIPFVYPHPLRKKTLPKPIDDDKDNKMNIALFKPTEASNTFQQNYSMNAVDNNVDFNNRWASNSFSDWWIVDLKDTYDLSAVTIINYYGDDRYYNFVIESSFDKQTWRQIAQKTNKERATKEGVTFKLTNKTGRYIRVRIYYSSVKTDVHLVEFRAFGNKTTNKSADNSYNTEELKLSSPIEEQQMIVFPNPANKNQDITITLNDIFRRMNILYIYDLYGQLILEKKFKKELGTPNLKIETSTLRVGYYNVVLKSGKKLLNKRILIH
ncbi:discoidin domain-containing protein [Aquimarina sp. ERC-38]|uniref:galactose-binding domain-containing protein n=1 Tax=Aquimarina sp. ERC-38 TaxID=2949996 RepID=UPI00224828C3|nr:discoidin domain-containing protein [Aquimarina sp. ERC-38]UZO81453.1 discoidin domain-containing protein [Aquimarina sp. ERC-38]